MLVPGPIGPKLMLVPGSIGPELMLVPDPIGHKLMLHGSWSQVYVGTRSHWSQAG